MRQTLLSTMLAVLALPALPAAAAQAAGTEGPWWYTGGTRLGAGETRAIKVSAEEPIVLRGSFGDIEVKCNALKFQTGATIDGSSGKNSSTGIGVSEFSECVGGGKSESLEGCEPVGGAIATVPVVGTLGYSSAQRGGEILLRFAPAKGTLFSTIKFTGASCFAASISITGSIAALWVRGGDAVSVGEELVSGRLLFSFNKTEKPSFFYESNGKLESAKAELAEFGTAATLEGVATAELLSGALFGISSEAE